MKSSILAFCVGIICVPANFAACEDDGLELPRLKKSWRDRNDESWLMIQPEGYKLQAGYLPSDLEIVDRPTFDVFVAHRDMGLQETTWGILKFDNLRVGDWLSIEGRPYRIRSTPDKVEKSLAISPVQIRSIQSKANSVMLYDSGSQFHVINEKGGDCNLSIWDIERDNLGRARCTVEVQSSKGMGISIDRYNVNVGDELLLCGEFYRILQIGARRADDPFHTPGFLQFRFESSRPKRLRIVARNDQSISSVQGPLGSELSVYCKGDNGKRKVINCIVAYQTGRGGWLLQSIPVPQHENSNIVPWLFGGKYVLRSDWPENGKATRNEKLELSSVAAAHTVPLSPNPLFSVLPGDASSWLALSDTPHPPTLAKFENDTGVVRVAGVDVDGANISISGKEELIRWGESFEADSSRVILKLRKAPKNPNICLFELVP